MNITNHPEYTKLKRQLDEANHILHNAGMVELCEYARLDRPEGAAGETHGH
jgi:hypothetical protein